MTLSFPSNFIPSSTVVLAIVLAIKAILKTSVDDDDDNND